MLVQLDHIVLNVEDARASCEFYKKILFFDIERMDSFEKGFVDFPSVRVNESTVIDLFPPELWKKSDIAGVGAKNLNHFCLAFSEIEWNGLIDRLNLNEINIERYSDGNWGAKGKAVSVYFHDLDGNEIEARYYKQD